MDSGNSFDGATLDYQLRIPFNNLKSPRNKKRFFKVVVEVETEVGVDSTIDLKYSPDFSYGDSNIPKGTQQTFEVASGGAYWDEGSEWGEFFWGQTQGEAEGYIKGSGRNIALSLSGESITAGSHTITGITIQYTVRGMKR